MIRTSRLSITFSAASAAVALITACGSGSSAGGAAGPGVTAFAQAACARVQRCGATQFAIQFGDAATCQSFYQQIAAFGLTLPGVATTDAEVKSCADAYNALDCNASDSSVPACQVAGTLATNAGCESDSQCQSSYCKFSANASPTAASTADCGTCQPKSGADGACTEDAGCTSGLVCNTATSKCVQPIAKGAACDALGTPCADGTRCVGAVCTATLPDGAKCDEAADACGGETTCQNGTCQRFDANVTVVDVGQPCGVDAATQKEVLCRHASCVGAIGSQKCVANAQAGQACSTSVDSSSTSGPVQTLPDCDGFLTCKNGTCVKPDPNECK